MRKNLNIGQTRTPAFKGNYFLPLNKQFTHNEIDYGNIKNIEKEDFRATKMEIKGQRGVLFETNRPQW